MYLRVDSRPSIKPRKNKRFALLLYQLSLYLRQNSPLRWALLVILGLARYIGIDMKRIVATLAILTLSLISFVALCEEREVLVGVYDNMPLTSVSLDGSAEGLMIDLLEATAEEEGWAIKYIPCKWSECVEMIKSGVIDLLGAVAYSEDRSEHYDYSHETAATNWGQLCAARGVGVTSMLDLDGMSVGILSGDIHALALQRSIGRWDIECNYVEVPDYISVLRLVEQGEADVGVVNRFFAAEQAANFDVEVTAVIFNPVENYYISPNGAGAGLLDAIDRHIAAWKADEDSIYYASLARWLETETREQLPAWVKWLLASLGVALLLLTTSALILRWLVRVRTSLLMTTTENLKSALDGLEEAREIAGLGRWELDLRTNELTWSDGIYHLFGLDPDHFEATYEAFLSVIHPEDREWVDETYTRSVETREPYDIVHRLLLKDGTVRHVREICRTDYDSSGTPVRSVGTVQDISRVMQQENEIEESERRFRLLYDEAPVACMTLDVEGRFILVNDVWAREFGYTSDEVAGRPILDLVVGESAAKAADCFANLKVAGESHNVEIVMTRKDGTTFIASITGRFSFSASTGELTHCHCVVRNVTEQRQAEARIEHLSRVLRAIREVNQLIVHEKDIGALLKTGCELLVSTRGYFNAWIVLLDDSNEIREVAAAGDCAENLPDLLERIRDGEIPQCMGQALVSSDVVAVADPASDCLECPLSAGYKGRSGFCRRLMISDSLRGVLTVSLPGNFGEDSEEQNLFLEVTEDVEFAVRSLLQERELAHSRERYRNLFQRSMDAVLMSDSGGTIVEANEAATALLGYPRAKLIGMRSVELHADPKQQAAFVEAVMREEGAISNWEATLVGADGAHIICQESATAVVDESGAIVGFQGILRDVTEQRQSEERLRSRLENTIATVAHVTETRDPYTAGHQTRVLELAAAIAGELGWSEEQLATLKAAAQLHDIGKIAIPAEILSKPAKLTETELSLIRQHTVVGDELLEAVDFGAPVRDIILQHHERLDGSGYPNGLRAEEILDEAKVIAVADVVEAMSSHRPYRASLGIDASLAEIESGRGVLYDPQIVDACLDLFREQGFRFTEAGQEH